MDFGPVGEALLKLLYVVSSLEEYVYVPIQLQLLRPGRVAFLRLSLFPLAILLWRGRSELVVGSKNRRWLRLGCILFVLVLLVVTICRCARASRIKRVAF